MHPLLKVLRLIILFTFTWGIIIGGTVGVFFLVRDTLTNHNTEIAAIVTVVFLFASILVGEKVAFMVNCMLARLSNQDPPACTTKGDSPASPNE
jgi:hypothetical protein